MNSDSWLYFTDKLKLLYLPVTIINNIAYNICKYITGWTRIEEIDQVITK